MKEFEFKLKEARKKQGLSQQELADKINSDQRVISEYERGARVPSVERLVELAQILDVSLDELIEFRRIHKEYSQKLNNTTSKGTIK